MPSKLTEVGNAGLTGRSIRPCRAVDSPLPLHNHRVGCLCATKRILEDICDVRRGEVLFNRLVKARDVRHIAEERVVALEARGADVGLDCGACQ